MPGARPGMTTVIIETVHATHLRYGALRYHPRLHFIPAIAANVPREPYLVFLEARAKYDELLLGFLGK